MRFSPLPLSGAYIIEPEVMDDTRGGFARLYCRRELEAIGGNAGIAQINQSFNRDKGALRGLHYRVRPGAEVKMVMCTRGAVFDVIVDLGKRSETFLKWHGEIISAENGKIIYVPERFAHGFQALEDDCRLIYFHSGFYDPLYERAIKYDDPCIGVKWPLAVSSISDRDRDALFLPPDFPGI